ncbi:MAG: hypothetical protein ACQESM_01780 [Bacteroidota bacterium]
MIATGGSAVYSDAAMAHLKSDGIIVFLDPAYIVYALYVHYRLIT